MAELLVIDDEFDWQELSRHQLEDMGHQVRTLGDCGRALAEIRTSPPDAVILDIRMPVSGRIMLGALRREFPGVPVIVHSAYGGYQGDAGFSDASAFVVKSTDPAHLSQALGQVLTADMVSSRQPD